MAIKTVDLSDFAKEIGVFSKQHQQALREATVHGIQRSIPDLIASSPVDTGQYAASWDFSSDEKSAILGNFAPHAPIIEFGARPFTPPLGPLLAWAKRVLQDPSQPPNYSDQVWGLALGTQKKISKEGMAPKGVLQKAIPRIIENIKKEFQKIG